MNTQAEFTYDTEGYQVNPEQWNKSIARTLAADEHIELDAAYWSVLQFMHDYWAETPSRT